jgi:hypothetical protein
VLLFADRLDAFQHRRPAAAHQLHSAGVPGPAERLERADRLLGLQADVEEDEIGGARGTRLAERRAVGEFHGVDAGALQDQRHEVPDTALLVDDKAERRAALGMRHDRDVGGGRCTRRLERCGSTRFGHRQAVPPGANASGPPIPTELGETG